MAANDSTPWAASKGWGAGSRMKQPLLFLLLTLLAFVLGPATSVPIPLVGYGTAHIKDEKTILQALEVGYRLIDTAVLYENQEAVGRALAQSRTPREEIYVATKVAFYPPSIFNSFFHWLDRRGQLPAKLKFLYMGSKGFEVEGLAWSQEQLQLDYIDACMVHAPVTSWTEFLLAFLPHRFGRFQGMKTWPSWLGPWTDSFLRGFDSIFGASQEAKKEVRQASWKALEDAYDKGLCRSIGVSNYDLALLEELETYARRPVSVLELEVHPRFVPHETLLYCRERGIHVIGYGNGLSLEETDSSKIIEEVARKTQRTPSQVTLRWAVEQNITVIPRTSKAARMRENLETLNFQLEPADLELLNSLNSDAPFYWDVSKLQTHEHPTTQLDEL